MSFFARISKEQAPKELALPIKEKTTFVTDESIDWKVLKVVYDDNKIVFEIVDLFEYTYIMSDDINSTYKIGRTTNKPTERLTNLRTANPNISMLMVFPSQEFSEKVLHEKYDAYRKDREWFFKAKELNQFIENSIKSKNLIIELYKNQVKLWKM